MCIRDRAASFRRFLVDRLEIDQEYAGSLNFRVIRYRTPHSKVTDEALITFDTPVDRDYVKSVAPALGGKVGRAGVRIHVPRHLQGNFKKLDRICFSLKVNYPNLKRSFKFDDEIMDIFADIKKDDDSPWERIEPDEAREAFILTKDTAGPSNNAPAKLQASNLSAMLAKKPSQPSS